MRSVRIAMLALVVAAGGVSAWHALAADPAAPQDLIASADISGCARCHTDPTERGMKVFRETHKSDKFALLNESETWLKHDPHSKALAVLKPENSKSAKQMSESKVLKDKYGDLTKAPACLTCHSIDKSPAKKLADKKVDDFFREEEFGINCFACHGLTGTWELDHTKPATWRNLPPEKKLEKGMINLRDPQIQATQCASCHVGNAAEGKVVTHEMYAAGHPPLLPLELATYIADEPQHWGTPFDPKLEFFKGLSDKDALEKFSYFKSEGLEGYTARKIAVGGIVGLKAEADLLLAEATEKEGKGGLDFARFDCYACHHDLKTPSARIERGYDGPPGRPPVKAWNGAFAGVIAEHAAGFADKKVADLAKEFAAKWQKVREAGWSQPYADAKLMKAAAKELSDWCNAYLSAIKASPVYSPEEAKKLHALLQSQTVAPKNVSDAEVAMVLVWAYHSLDQVINKTQPDWSKLRKYLPVRLREKTSITGEKPVTVGELLKDRMMQFNDYDAAEFKKLFPPK